MRTEYGHINADIRALMFPVHFLLEENKHKPNLFIITDMHIMMTRTGTKDKLTLQWLELPSKSSNCRTLGSATFKMVPRPERVKKQTVIK